jgi:hypothetical protein
MSLVSRMKSYFIPFILAIDSASPEFFSIDSGDTYRHPIIKVLAKRVLIVLSYHIVFFLLHNLIIIRSDKSIYIYAKLFIVLKLMIGMQSIFH